MKRPAVLALGIGFALLLGIGPAGRAAPGPQEVAMPSALPSGQPAVDRIWVRFFPADAPDGRLCPAVVVLPPVGSDERDPLMGRLATFLAGQGISSAVMALPHHGWRRLGGETPAASFAGGNIAAVIQAFRQSASDTGTVADWLSRRPGVDPARVGVVGISLGAIVAHLAMGQDERLRVGVAVLGGGDLPDLYHASLLARIQELLHPRHFTRAALARLRPVDPLTYTDRNRPRHVLMIEAARDLLVPPHDALELWQALGRPPIQWLDTNHFAFALAPNPLFRTIAAYLRAQWSGGPSTPLPRASAPTLKIGLLSEMGMGLSPALQWQFLSLGMRPDHIALLHADLGLSGRGPFAGLAVTVNPFFDLGLSARPGRRGAHPYFSLHVVF